MSNEITCLGLPASWVNAWLAAVGVTVLDRRVRLHWTVNGRPTAVLSAAEISPIDALVESWPNKEFLADLPIAEHWKGTDPVQRKVSVEAFMQRVRMARGHPYSWTLSSTMTDLCVDKNGDVEHALFDPAGPGSIKWLHHRVTKLQAYLDNLEMQLRASLMGYARRVEDNGLGFDYTRLKSSGDAMEKCTDPIVETLAFFGLRLFPVRGNGVDQRLAHGVSTGKRQRGWRTSSPRQNELRFHWPAWSQPLDFTGIDALMDVWNPALRSTWERLGIHAGWNSVKFKTAAPDKTRAFGSERL